MESLLSLIVLQSTAALFFSTKGEAIISNDHQATVDEKFSAVLSLLEEQRHHEAICLFVGLLENLNTMTDMESQTLSLLPHDERASLIDIFPAYHALLYTDWTGPDAQSFEKMVSEYSPKKLTTPKFFTLILLANQGRTEEFYKKLYNMYCQSPESINHPLSLKIQAVLKMRLYEGERDYEQRENFRKEALKSVEKAFYANPMDSSLIQKALFLASSNPDSREQEKVLTVFGNIIVASEYSPYKKEEYLLLLQRVVDSGNINLAKQLIEKGKKWYHYSRALSTIESQIG